MAETVMEQSALNENVQIIRKALQNDEVYRQQKKKKAAAYCRVSTDLSVQQQSLDLQMESFKKVIANHPDWVLADIYADEGLTGTQTKNRPAFMKMMESARAHEIDVILVKSVSRFARNTADSLLYTRELSDIGVSVYFEKEGIDTSSFASEFLLTIFAAFAQEESHSISENVKRGLRNRYKIGEVPWYNVYGYRKGWIINEEEAAVIRRIFNSYLDGKSTAVIAKELNSEGIPTPRGGKTWDRCVILDMLRNEKYVGDALLQKTYVQSFVTHKRVNNQNADIDQYYKSNNHTPIIDRDTFDLVQKMILMQAGKKGTVMFPYYGILKCPYCGEPMIRVWNPGGIRQSAWTCGGKGPKQLLQERTSCPTFLLLEKVLERTVKKAVMNLNPTIYEEYSDVIIKAQNVFKQEDHLPYGLLQGCIDSITLSGNDQLVIRWKMGFSYAYPIDYQKVQEAVLPDVTTTEDGEDLIVGIPLKGKDEFIKGFQKRQNTVRNYRVIETDSGIPVVRKGGKEK